MDLSICQSHILDDLKANIGFLIVRYPADDCDLAYQQISELFQGLSICQLLVENHVNKFYENLVRSGYARRSFLSLCQSEGNTTNRFLGLSRSQADLDAIVAGHMNLARDIADLSLATWNRDWEYEVDWCFHRFVHLTINDGAEDEIRGVLGSWADVLEKGGDDDLRLPVCRAISNGDTDEFASQIQEFTEDRESRLEEQRKFKTDPSFIFWPASFVNIEALALLRLADISDLGQFDELPLCPISRLAVVSAEYPDDFFQELPSMQISPEEMKNGPRGN